jgi:hypothetical protein
MKREVGVFGATMMGIGSMVGGTDSHVRLQLNTDFRLFGLLLGRLSTNENGAVNANLSR